MGQAKIRAKEIQKLKNPLSNKEPLFQSKNGSIKIFKHKSLDAFQEITGRLPYEFENMEYMGTQISDQMVGGNSQEELYIGSWKDMIVEVNGRTGKGSKEYFAIRLTESDVVVSRPAYGDKLTLTGIEAAIARFALSANSISWYATAPQNKGVVRISPFGYLKGEDAAEYYHMAMFAADQLDLFNVYRYLD